VSFGDIILNSHPVTMHLTVSKGIKFCVPETLSRRFDFADPKDSKDLKDINEKGTTWSLASLGSLRPRVLGVLSRSDFRPCRDVYLRRRQTELLRHLQAVVQVPRFVVVSVAAESELGPLFSGKVQERNARDLVL